ncbi:MAG: hypothetical protein ACI4XI_05905 [Ruminococcus sp.]
MPKFCGKCGSKIDETTGLCPECNKNSDLHNISETDKSDSHINTDIDTAVISEPEYEEEKPADISEKAAFSKFCKKCGSKIDADTGLCPMCNKTDYLHNISETDKSDSHINTDIDTAVISEPEYEEKAADISEKAAFSKFCKKCGSKIDADTGLCPKCDAVQNYSDGQNNPDEESEKATDGNSEYEENPVAPVYQDNFYGENPEDSETDIKMSKSTKITISVIVITVILIIAFALLDLFGVIGTGIFKSFGIDPINSEITSTESTEVSSSVIETTIVDTTAESTTAETTVPKTTAKVETEPETTKKAQSSKSESSNAQSNNNASEVQEPTEKNDESWKTDLIDLCISGEENEDASFVLIYVNDDDIPEVYVMHNSYSSESDFVYCINYHGGAYGASAGYGLNIPHRSLYYYERGNLCCAHTEDYDDVYTMKDCWWQPTGVDFDINGAIYAPDCVSYSQSEIINIIENM